MILIQTPTKIILDGMVTLTPDDFHTLEPNLPTLPSGYTQRVYIPEKIHEISGEGMPTTKDTLNWEDGNRYLKRIETFIKLQRKLDSENAAIKNAVDAELKKTRPYHVNRIEEYPPIEQLVIAMWENLVEKKTKKDSGVTDLQKVRAEIQKKYPKPEKKGK